MGYKEILQKNNSELQIILDTVNELPESGESGGVNWLEYATSIKGMFADVNFQTGTEIELNLKNITLIEDAFRRTSGLKKITLNAPESDVGVGAAYAFWGATNNELETIDLSGFKRSFSSMAHTFRGCPNLKYIYGELDMSTCTQAGGMFLDSKIIQEVRFKKGSICINIDCSSSSNLSTESIQSIIDGLADLTGETEHTVSFNSSVKAKLTDEQKTQITSKNWILT